MEESECLLPVPFESSSENEGMERDQTSIDLLESKLMAVVLMLLRSLTALDAARSKGNEEPLRGEVVSKDSEGL